LKRRVRRKTKKEEGRRLGSGSTSLSRLDGMDWEDEGKVIGQLWCKSNRGGKAEGEERRQRDWLF
jgi:hypothetical protein